MGTNLNHIVKEFMSPYNILEQSDIRPADNRIEAMLHIQSSVQFHNRNPINNTTYWSDKSISPETNKKIHVSSTDCFECIRM